MHFDGNYTDFSPLGQAFTNTGATTTTTGAKFGESVGINGTNPGGGGANKIKSSATRAEYDVMLGDLTLEAFIKPASTATNGGGARPIISFSTTTGGTGSVALSAYGNNIGTYFRFDVDGTFSLGSDSVATYLTNGVWYHIAVVRKSGVTYLFLDGSLLISTTGGAGISSGSVYATVGNFATGNQAFHGDIDEARATKAGRYTAGFTPPTAPYQNS